MTTPDSTSNPWIIEPYFRISELRCPCCNRCRMDPAFLQKLKQLREKLGFALRITSGYRCEDHNDAIRGGRHSQHLYGKAVDISLYPLASNQIYKLLGAAIELGFRGIGIDKVFIHIDSRDGEGKVWTY